MTTPLIRKVRWQPATRVWLPEPVSGGVGHVVKVNSPDLVTMVCGLERWGGNVVFAHQCQHLHLFWCVGCWWRHDAEGV